MINSKAFKKAVALLCTAVILFSCISLGVSATESKGYVVVTDYVDVNTGKDVSSAIQAIIDANPNKTIFFPDGEYVLSSPVLTPANPRKSVSLKLSDFAVLIAGEGWEKGQAVVQLGGKDPFNDTHTPGSNYSFEGGVVDGRGVANGISINSGRETVIRETSIKNAVVGIHIMHGANNGSSDSDITGINIIGTGSKESTGILIEGYDNTITNVRIGCVYTGVHVKSGGNMLRNIHPLYYSDFTDFENSCGFLIEAGNNWFDYCYADNFGIGYRTTGNFTCTFVNCFCYWYTNRGKTQTFFKADDKFNSNIVGASAGFNGDNDVEKNLLEVGTIGGTGSIRNIDADTGSCNSQAFLAYWADGNFLTRVVGFFALLFEQLFSLV